MSWDGFPVEGLALLNELEPQTRQLFDALTERAYAVRMSSLSNNTPINFPSPMPAESLQRIPWRAWQNLARGQCFSFLHPDKVPGGPDYSLEGVDHPTHGTAGFGYNATLFFYSSFNEIYAAAGLPPEGFTRKRPWNISDPDPPEGIHALGGNPIVKREAGAWVPAPGRGHPDLKTEYGLALPGDTIGPWLWNELRDVLNLMKVGMVGERYTYYFGDNGGLRRDYHTGLNRETPEEAINAAIANGQDASGGGGGGGGNVLAFAALSYYDYSTPALVGVGFVAPVQHRQPGHPLVRRRTRVRPGLLRHRSGRGADRLEPRRRGLPSRDAQPAPSHAAELVRQALDHPQRQG